MPLTEGASFYPGDSLPRLLPHPSRQELAQITADTVAKMRQDQIAMPDVIEAMIREEVGQQQETPPLKLYFE